MRRLIISIGLVLSVLFLGSITLLVRFFRNPTPGSLEFEIAKSLLQLGVVAVVSAVISLLIFEYQQERQALEKEKELDQKRLEYRETLLLSILSRAMDAYGRAKTARRVLRGRSVMTKDNKKAVLATQYDIFFNTINDAQLDLENLARDVETSVKVFSKPTALVEHFRSMDSYLGELIEEYEKSRYRFVGDEPLLPLYELPLLEDYLKSTKESKFLKEMVIHYHEVQAKIRSELLYPNISKPV